MMMFETVLEEVGSFGRFQILTIILLASHRITMPMHFLLNVFTAALPSHHCDISTLDDGVHFQNLTHEQRLAVSIPVGDDGGMKSCEMFVEPQFQLLSNGSNSTNLPTVQCQSGWVYDRSTFTSTLATEWDLVCERKQLAKATSTIFFIGVATASLVFGFFCDKWIPESARWLLTSGRVDKAVFYLNRCAHINKKPKSSLKLKLQTLSSAKIQEKQQQNNSYYHLIKTPKMRRLTLATGVVWFGVSMAFFAISLNISGFEMNMYLTHFAYAAIEVPANFVSTFLLNAIGRKKCQSGALLLTGACVAINIFIPKGLWHVRAIVAIIGKGLAEISSLTVTVYTTELFPTVLRQKGFGYNSVMGRVGSSVAPLVLMLEDVWTPLPQIIICSVVITSTLVSLLLPETLNVRLPETIDDIENPRDHTPSHPMESADVLLETKPVIEQ
ncbi:solute carrier family 22 member 7-like isoform X3 [Thalassophryne amazonica]|uniref:solute carrier family 22 member 7-like isoform X3 n=1 Tax=Thalassophryne amazonica TaxID=390379 RepID=UPI0014725005|nr:solute carrier family 22 member 7-like isoform X3 [Thalassophryne amazonica]